MANVATDEDTSAADRRGPIAFFARSPVAANMMMLLFLGAGTVAALLLPVQSTPDFDPRAIQVTVPYPGATAEEVEEGVTRRVEERVRGVIGVRRVRSVAEQGIGMVTAELDTFASAALVLADVQRAVESLDDFPPEFAEKPRVERQPLLRNVATVAAVSATASEPDLRRAAELVRERLLAQPTVSHVDMFGGRDYEVSIEVSEAALLRNDLTVEEVAAALQQASVNQTSGELRTGAGGVVIRTSAKRQQAAEFADIAVLTRPDGSMLRLGDVAKIRDGFTDDELVSRIDGRPAVFLRVRESDAGDPQVVAAAQAVMAAAAEIELPAGMDVVSWEDGSERVRIRTWRMVANAVLGITLVFAFLLLVFDLRFATWITLGIPIAFLGGMLMFEPFGLTINSMTLLTLVLVTGIVVDDAIVVGESIAVQHESGNTGVAGAIAGARAVVGPVVTGVVTTMVAFAILAFMPGPVGQMVSAVPYVVVAVLAVSLLEAFVILPAHLAYGRPWSRPPLAQVQAGVRRWLDQLRDNVVVRAISAALLRPWLTIAAAVAFLAVAALLVSTSLVRFVLYDPPADVDRLSAHLAFPVGTPFAVTERAVNQVVGAAHATDQAAAGDPFGAIAVIVGGDLAAEVDSIDAGHQDSEYASHLATVVAVLNDEPTRSLSSNELLHMWRSRVGELQGAESVAYNASSMVTIPEIGFVLTHDDPDALALAGDDFKEYLAGQEGVYGTTTSLAAGKRQFDIEVNSLGIAIGLTADEVAAQLRDRFHGVEVQRNQRGRDEMQVVVRYPGEERLTLADILDERIPLPVNPAGQGAAPGAGQMQGGLFGGAMPGMPAQGANAGLPVPGVPLALVAQVTETRGLAAIERQDGRRSALIQARVDTARRTPNSVNADIEGELLPRLLAKYPGLDFEYAGQLELQERTFGVLALLVAVAGLIIYGLIAIQLKSYLLPLVVIAAVPFAAAGAVIGHLLLGYDLSAYSVFGMVAIGGVVVNDVLVLLDRYRTIRAQSGQRADVAMVSAATRHRFRAILLTTVTTLTALLPTIYTGSAFSAPLIPLIISMVAGLAFANAVLLFFVPALLTVLEGFQERLGRYPGEPDLAATPGEA
ncbi:MAG: efflux RND transporter permease subunit [Gammaproteobacteria bacterium]|nr:efflux RND transporter permease subunit [Gammaproteobacteria bacterium]